MAFKWMLVHVLVVIASAADSRDAPCHGGECHMTEAHALLQARRSDERNRSILMEEEAADTCSDSPAYASSCPGWAAQYCEDNTFKAWMTDNCKKSCRKCPCVNSDDNCDTWAGLGECCNNFNYMVDNCRKACGTCSSKNIGCTEKPTAQPTAEPTAQPTAEPTAQPTKAPTQPPAADDTAVKDTHKNKAACADWAKKGYCEGNWGVWMLANCAKSCSMPAPTPAPTTPAPTWHGSCVDESDWCPIWAVGGQCESNPGYMESACKLSCICNPPAPTPAPKPELLVLYAGSGEKEGSLNLVFVPSGFDDINVFNEKVKPIIDSMMNEYSPYDARKVKALNYFILNSKAPGDDGTYCGRFDPPRAVSCKEGPKFQKLVESYIPGLHVETVVLHNEDKYGGSGSKGMAVVTWGDRAYEVLAHELGHSFFGLSDEYELEASFQGIVGTDAVANLDDKDCSKWTDLMDKDLGVGCEGGHGKGKAYFASGKTFMNDIKDPFGAANERISCCKYVKLIAWNDMPVYCHKFSQNGLNLKTFCKSSAVKLWWEGSLFQDGDFKANATREQKLLRQVNDPQGHHYAWVEAPTRWTLSNVEGDWRCVKVNDLPSGIYFKDEVLGHAAEEETLAAEGRADRSLTDEHRIELVVTAWDRNAGSDRELIFLPESRAEAPPKVRDGSPGYWGGNTPDTVIEMTDIDFILNQGESCILWVGDSSRRLS